MLSSSGLVKRQTNTAYSDTSCYDWYLEDLHVRSEALLERYTRHFAVIDALVSQYNSTRTSLQGSFDAMFSMYSNK